MCEYCLLFFTTFANGFARGTIAACIRLSLLFKSDFDTDPSCTHNHRDMYQAVSAYKQIGNAVDWISWSIIEPGVYIFAACFPPYRILFSHFRIWTRLSIGFSKISKSYASSGVFHTSSNRNRSGPLDGSREAFTGSSARTVDGSVNAIWSTKEHGDIPMDAIYVKHDFQLGHAA